MLSVMCAQGMDGATFASATGAVLASRGVADHAEQESILQLRDQLLLEPAACIKHLSGSFLVGSPRPPASKGPTQDDITAGDSFTIPAVQQGHRVPGGTGMTLAGTAAAGRRSSSPTAGPQEPADSSKAVLQAPAPPAPLVSAASAGGDVLVSLAPRLDVGLQGMAARVRYWSVSGMIPEYDGREAIPVVVQVEDGMFKRCAAAAPAAGAGVIGASMLLVLLCYRWPERHLNHGSPRVLRRTTIPVAPALAPICQLGARLHQQQQEALYQRRNCTQLLSRACAAQALLLSSPSLRYDLTVLRRLAEVLTEASDLMAQFSSRCVPAACMSRGCACLRALYRHRHVELWYRSSIGLHVVSRPVTCCGPGDLQACRLACHHDLPHGGASRSAALPPPPCRGWLCRMAHPLHDKEDFERLDTTLADLMTAAAAAAAAADGEGSGDALLRQGLADFSAAGAPYEEGHEAVAVVLVELAAGQEGRPPNLEAVCVALQPMLQLGELLRHVQCAAY